LTVAQALQALEPREARLLLAAASGFSEASLIAFPERDLPGDVQDTYLDFVQKRKAGQPVAYILGRKEFYGLELAVNPSVLIPRPETELLVDLSLHRGFSSVLDLGTGSGAIALALKKHRSNARVVAVEASAAALAVAQRNAVKHNLQVDFRHGRWFRPLGGERFDLIVSNPPYVGAGDSHLDALRHEPRSALVSGTDGLDAIREIARHAPAHLASGGWLLLEHGMNQDAAVRDLLHVSGLQDIATWRDLAGLPRVSGGRLE
jgi:release factor glutamine methyltransferase